MEDSESSKENRSLTHIEESCSEDALCRVLGIRNLQTRIYWLLVGREMEISDIATIVNRDRTSVQRTVQDLIIAGLVTRKHLSVKRGRKYAYRSISVDALKKKLNRELDLYYEKLRREIASIKEH